MNVDLGRREMIGMLVALPAGLFLVRCGSSTSSSGTGPGTGPTSNGTQNIYPSSSSNGHTHTFTLDRSAITTPPLAGVAGPTSTDSGHSHDVTISAAQLGEMDIGQSVNVTTSSVGAHTHVFTFTKLA